MVHRWNSESDHQRLRDAIKNWRAWHQWWKLREQDFLRRMHRRALACAVYGWHLGASASRSRRQGAIRILRSLLLRKCLLALANNAYTARVLRPVLESYRRRTLRDGLEAWGLFLVSQENQSKTKDLVVESPAQCVTTRRRRHPGKPRKVHCRCVYAVSRGQRCTCAPRSHLLRRVEELHRLVAKGLDGRDGGHRLLSHVVQRTTAPRHFERGSSCERILSPLRASEGRGKASCDDLQQVITTPYGRLVAGGKVCGPSLTSVGSDKPTPPGTSKPSNSLMEGSYRALSAAAFPTDSVTQHTILGEGQNDVLTGVASWPVVADGPRCVHFAHVPLA